MGEAGPYHWIVQLRRSSTAGMALLHQQPERKQKKMHAAKEKGKEKTKGKEKEQGKEKEKQKEKEKENKIKMKGLKLKNA